MIAKAARPPLLVPGLELRAGQTLAGRYRVESRLGGGAAGVVLAARNVHQNQDVTLKILAGYTDGQADVLARRVKTARVAAHLDNPHVAKILDVGTTEHGAPYIASERLTGTTLDAELDVRGPLPIPEAMRWILEACEGIASAHAIGLVHGDLKPSNLFLAEPRRSAREKMKALAAGETPDTTRTLKILDFGMSALDTMDDASATAFFGSPAYLAPEQIQNPGVVDARADVWALGVILYEMLSCSLPFTADTLSGVLVAVCFDVPAMLTTAPYDLATIVHRCLERDPAKRPQSVLELARALEPFAGAEGARLSERVSVALSTSASADESGATAPVSLSAARIMVDDLDVPILPRRRSTHEGPTSPSQRVRARRRHLSQAVAFAMFAGALAIVGLTWRRIRADVVSATAATALEAPPAATTPEIAAPTEAVTAPAEPALPTTIPTASLTGQTEITSAALAAFEAASAAPAPVAAPPVAPSPAPFRAYHPQPHVSHLPPELPTTREAAPTPPPAAPSEPPAALFNDPK